MKQVTKERDEALMKLHETEKRRDETKASLEWFTDDFKTQLQQMRQEACGFAWDMGREHAKLERERDEAIGREHTVWTRAMEMGSKAQGMLKAESASLYLQIDSLKDSLYLQIDSLKEERDRALTKAAYATQQHRYLVRKQFLEKEPEDE